MTIAPVLAMCAADGLVNVMRWGPRVAARLPRCALPAWLARRGPRRGLVLVTAAMLLASVVLTMSLRRAPEREIVYPPFYRAPALVAAIDRAIAHVPSAAPVNANDTVLTHLSHRQFASEIAPDRPLRGYLVANLGEPIGEPVGNASFAAAARRDRRQLAALGASWHRRFTAGVGAAVGCYGLLTRADRSAPSCFAAASGRFAPGQRALTAALAAAHASSRGPCSDLAARAHVAIQQVGDRLRCKSIDWERDRLLRRLATRRPWCRATSPTATCRAGWTAS